MALSRKTDPLKKKLTIQKDIQIPTPAYGRKPFYPVKTMEPGDSFFVPANEEKIETVRSTINSNARRNGVRIAIRKVTENNKLGLRVWRVE